MNVWKRRAIARTLPLALEGAARQRKPWLCGYHVDGMWWFRVFGWGLAWKDVRRHPPLFSERVGHRNRFRIGGWRLGLLAGWLLLGCGGSPEPPTDTSCNPPSFVGCPSPGGGVIRCQWPDGTYWDKQPDGTIIHWQWTDADAQTPEFVTLCTVKP